LSKDKIKDNVILFPGVKAEQYDKVRKDNAESIEKLNEDLLREKEEVTFVENLIDEVAIDLIRNLVDAGCNVHRKEFYGDLAMITELVRGMIYRDMDKYHISQALIDKVINIQHNEKGEIQPVINYGKVLEQKDLPQQELDFGEKEIHFEPDFEIPIPPEDDDK
tara:strand:+ start:93 stop:584 length:492 start_codon:yes stop_codon:yes gene_type:complete